MNKLFKSANINCPTIHGFSDDLSYILLEDLGKEVLDICEISNLDTFQKYTYGIKKNLPAPNRNLV